MSTRTGRFGRSKKGFLCTMEPGEDDDVTFTYDMLGISGGELKLLVGGMLQLGMKLGMFGHGEEEE